MKLSKRTVVSVFDVVLTILLFVAVGYFIEYVTDPATWGYPR